MTILTAERPRVLSPMHLLVISVVLMRKWQLLPASRDSPIACASHTISNEVASRLKVRCTGGEPLDRDSLIGNVDGMKIKGNVHASGKK